MLEAFCDTLPDNAVVVEAGAYHGEDTVRLAECVGFVHAFEPVSFNELEAAASPWQNVECWSYALGGESGEREIWVSGGPHTAASSLLKPKLHRDVLPAISFDERATVEVTTLAAWASDYEVDHVDGLWLDLQGMELAVLKAADPVIDSVSSMVLEVSRVELYEGCPLAYEVRDWLESRGFWVIAEVDQGAEQANWLVTRG